MPWGFPGCHWVLMVELCCLAELRVAPFFWCVESGRLCDETQGGVSHWDFTPVSTMPYTSFNTYSM